MVHWDRKNNCTVKKKKAKPSNTLKLRFKTKILILLDHPASHIANYFYFSYNILVKNYDSIIFEVSSC